MPQGCDVTQSEWFKTKGNKTESQILLEKVSILEQRILRLENIIRHQGLEVINPWQK